MKKFFASMMCSIAVAAVAFAGDKERPLQVFVLAGTSNMLGANAKVEKLPSEWREPIKDVLVNRQGVWTPLEAGKNLVGNEATFGLAMSKHLGQPVGIVWVSAASISSPPPNLGNMVKLARDKEKPIVITGLLVDVSYRDGIKEETAKSYAENLPRWIDSVRRDVGNPKLPIVMNRGIPPGKGTPFLDVVRKAQDAAKLPHFRVFPCDDVARGPDNVHFNTDGRLEMGKRFAAAMIELLNEQK